MIEFLKEHQLNIMLFLSGICAILACLTFITSSLSARRRRILATIEIAAMLLLLFDRFAYIYRDVLPQQTVREELIKGMGTQFDEKYAKIMLHLIDLDQKYQMRENPSD